MDVYGFRVLVYVVSSVHCRCAGVWLKVHSGLRCRHGVRYDLDVFL